MFSEVEQEKKKGVRIRASAWSCPSPPLQVVKKQISNSKESKLLLRLAELQRANTESVLLQNTAQPAHAGNKDLARHTHCTEGLIRRERSSGEGSHRKRNSSGPSALQAKGQMTGVCAIMAEHVVMSQSYRWTHPQGKTGINSHPNSVFLPLLSCVKPNVLSITLFSSPNHTFRPFLHAAPRISSSQQFLFSTSPSNKFKLPKTAHIILCILCSSDFFFPLLQDNFFQPLK